MQDGYCIIHKRAYHNAMDKSQGWSRTKYTERRIRVLAAYGGACAECGEDHPGVLQLDHDHRGEAKAQREGHGASHSSGSSLLVYLIKHNFPDRYRLLCLNCHKKKHMKKPKITRQEVAAAVKRMEI